MSFIIVAGTRKHWSNVETWPIPTVSDSVLSPGQSLQQAPKKIVRETAMTIETKIRDAEVLQTVISELQKLDPPDRDRILHTVSTFFGVEAPHEKRPPTRAREKIEPATSKISSVPFSEDLAQAPKDFLLEKQPRTDVERIACLAYYLTHYRNTPYFKTLELSKLNTEAAQPKFSNAANSANNAVKTGYLVSGTQSRRQLSAGGEQFVQALPDRELAKNLMGSFRPRRKVKRKRLTPTENTGS